MSHPEIVRSWLITFVNIMDVVAVLLFALTVCLAAAALVSRRARSVPLRFRRCTARYPNLSGHGERATHALGA
ncbi:MAG TPA: hypothetical protein VGM03_07670 [Phycisphaerae bacterium]|jgi:hypothetical protein